MTTKIATDALFRPTDGSVIYEPEKYEKQMTLVLPPDFWLAIVSFAVTEIDLRWVWYSDEAEPNFEVNLRGVPLTAKGKPDKRATYKQYVWPNTTQEVQMVMNWFPQVAELPLHGLDPKPVLSFDRQQVRDKMLIDVLGRIARHS